jgi:hypothetical protein
MARRLRRPFPVSWLNGQPADCGVPSRIGDLCSLAGPSWRQRDPGMASKLQRDHKLGIQQPREIAILERALWDDERVPNASLGLDHEDLHRRVEFEIVAVLATTKLSLKKFADQLQLLLIERHLHSRPFIDHDESWVASDVPQERLDVSCTCRREGVF